MAPEPAPAEPAVEEADAFADLVADEVAETPADDILDEMEMDEDAGDAEMDDAGGEDEDGGTEDAAPEDDEEPLSQDDLDNMFGDDDEPAPIESMVDGDDADDEEDNIGELDDLDNLPDPEPIPEVFTSGDSDDDDDDDDEDESGGGKLRIIIAVVAVLMLLGGLYGGLIAARGMVTSFWPAADSIFDTIDFFQAPLGDGLKITNVKSGRAPEKNSDAILIGGDIVNVSDDTKLVPTIRVSLFNADNEEVQFLNVTPYVQQLMAGKKYAFTSRLENPAPSARQIKVTFIKAPKGAGQAPDSHAPAQKPAPAAHAPAAHAPAAPAPAAHAPAAPAPAAPAHAPAPAQKPAAH